MYQPLNIDRLGDAVIQALNDAGFDTYGVLHGDWYENNPVPEGWPKYATCTGNLIVLQYLNDDESGKPNLYDMKTGLALSWYKYAPRELSANKQASDHEVRVLLMHLREDARAAGAKPYDSDKEYQKDIELWKIENELNAELASRGSFDVPERLQAELDKKIRRYGSLRKAETTAELTWAIRLDPLSTRNSMVIDSHRIPGSSRGRISVTIVETENENVIVKREIRLSNGQGQGTSILFHGSIQDFNDTAWALLLAERIGNDITSLSDLGTTMPTVEMDENRVNVADVVMCDVRRPNTLTLRPPDIHGTTHVSVEFQQNEGKIRLSIDVGTKNERSAELYMDDIRLAILLAEMAEADEFDITLDRNDDYAHIEIGDVDVSCGMADCWKRMSETDKKE